MSQEKVERLFGEILCEMGIDWRFNPHLADTPKRIAKMFCNEIFTSYNDTFLEEPKITTFKNETFDEIIMLDNIPFTSTCSHHFVPFSGLAWFAYIPGQLAIGASKVARVIQYLSKKPQVQENLSIEVMDMICNKLSPKGAMLVMRAVHSCMACRGAMTGLEAGMITSVTRGCFRDNAITRQEALELIKISVAVK